MMKKIKAEKLWRILPGIDIKSKSILKSNEIDWKVIKMCSQATNPGNQRENTCHLNDLWARSYFVSINKLNLDICFLSINNW